MKGLTRGLMLVAIAALGVPATAAGDTVAIGSALPSYTNAYGCSATCIQAQHTAGPAATLPQASPVNGEIIGWAVRSGILGAKYHLRVLHPIGGLGYMPTGTTSAPTPIPAATDTRYDYSALLPIQQGDALGLSEPTGLARPVHFAAASGFNVMFADPGPADGASATFVDNGSGSNFELLVQATIRFCRMPNAVGLRLVDAFPQFTDCPANVITRKLKRTKKNRKLKGRVITQSPPAGATAKYGTIDTLTVAGLKKKHRRKKH